MFVSKCKLFLVRGSKKEVLMDRTRFTSFSSSTSASNPVTSAPFPGGGIGQRSDYRGEHGCDLAFDQIIAS